MDNPGLDVTPLAAPLGAEVRGVDASVAPDARIVHELKQRIAEFGCILLREQSLTEEQHVAFAEAFGETTVPWLNSVELNTLARIKELPGRPGYTGAHPGVVYFVNGPQYRDKPDDGYLQGWHADMTHLQVPLPYALLHAIEAPQFGYETWLSNQYLAYESLEPDVRAKVDGLFITHSFQHVFPRLPPVVHPVALAHPRTGRRAIYGIPGVADACPLGVPHEEGTELITRLSAHLHADRFVYHHAWRKGDLLVWDNRCVLHRRGPQAGGQTRILRRVMAGDGDPGAVRQMLLGQEEARAG